MGYSQAPFGAIPAPPAPPPPKAANPRRKLYIWLGIGSGLLILFAMIAVAIAGVRLLVRAGAEPAKALDTYTASLIQKDYQRAYQAAAPGFREATSYEALLAYHAKLTARLGELKSVKQTYWYIGTRNGVESSTIQAALKFDRGTEVFQFILRKDSGAWRVFSYKEVKTAGVEDN